MVKKSAHVYRIDKDATLPVRKSSDAVGYDICTLEAFMLYPGQRHVARTGLVVQPPPGMHTEIFLRSGMAYKHNIVLINGLGLIDRDYAGPTDELMVMLYRAPKLLPAHNIPGGTVAVYSDYTPVHFKKGDRIAQLVFRETELLNIVEVDRAPGANRGGLGSTGS